MCDIQSMIYEIKATAIYRKWFQKLKDIKAKARIATRLDYVQRGYFGDHKDLSSGVSELRFSFGPGYRIYYTIKNGQVVLLLAGGDKSSQNKDINRACAILEKIEE